MDWMILPFKRYFDFTGRSRRMEYWMFTLLMVIVYSVLAAIMMAGGYSVGGSGMGEPSALFYVGAGLAGLFVLAVIIPSIAVAVRRLHDRDMSGWWYLGFVVASMIPVIGFLASIAMLVLMCLPGTPGPNRFGPDPLDPTNSDVFA